MEDIRRRRLQIDWQRGLIPLSLLILFVLRFGFGAPLWALVAFTGWIPLYYVVFPLYLSKRWKAFDREFTLRFQKGDYKGLLAHYQKQHLLRRFGPRQEMLCKLGLIFSAMERYREAEHAFERALSVPRAHPSDQLYFNLANTKYELGKYDDARQIYRSLRAHSPYKQSVRAHLALIDLHKGTRVQQARELLEQERPRATGLLRSRIDDALLRHGSQARA